MPRAGALRLCAKRVKTPLLPQTDQRRLCVWMKAWAKECDGADQDDALS